MSVLRSGGHYVWDNDNTAQLVCRQLGYSDGELYTYGHTSQLPTLPIVAGFRACQGTELNLFTCEERGRPVDRDCLNGCVGADGYQGTMDDTIDRKVVMLSRFACCPSR